MLVRKPGTKTFRQWDGRNLEEFAAAGCLHTTVGRWPAAVPWRTATTYTGALPSEWTDIGAGFTTKRVLPRTAANISVERANAADTGAVVVEYLNTDWYHRSAAYSLANTPASLAVGGTGASVGQTVSAWRILGATYLAEAMNLGDITVKIGTDAQVRIPAGCRVSSMGSTTVPRGQILTLTSYRAAVDSTKTVALQWLGGPVDMITGVVRLAVRNESGESNEHFAGTYRPERVQAVSVATGARVFSPIDLCFMHKTAAGNTSGTVDGTFRGVMQLDEYRPDPEPGKIPWVAAAVADMLELGWWPIT